MNIATIDLPVKTCSSNYAEKTVTNLYPVKSAVYVDPDEVSTLVFNSFGTTYQLLFGSDRLIA
jgi:hypothetical protein